MFWKCVYIPQRYNCTSIYIPYTLHSLPGFCRLRMHTSKGPHPGNSVPVAFVEFKNAACAASAMATLQGRFLLSSDRGAIRIEFAKSKMAAELAAGHAAAAVATAALISRQQQQQHQLHQQQSAANAAAAAAAAAVVVQQQTAAVTILQQQQQHQQQIYQQLHPAQPQHYFWTEVCVSMLSACVSACVLHHAGRQPPRASLFRCRNFDRNVTRSRGHFGEVIAWNARACVCLICIFSWIR